MVYITVENTADYAQTWPFELVDDTGNVWWPRGQSLRTQNYTLTDSGYLTVYAHKKARILTAIGPLYQNTTFYLKIGGLTMTTTKIKVNGTPYLKLTSVSCKDLWLNPTSGGFIRDLFYITFGGTVNCQIGFTNLQDDQVGIQLRDSEVMAIDFPLSHSKGTIVGKGSSTVILPNKTGYIHIKFSVSTSDFAALARYWIHGYYTTHVTMKLKLTEAFHNQYHTYIYTIRSPVTIKTSNTVYGAVMFDGVNVFPLGKNLGTIGKFTLIGIKSFAKKESADIVIRTEAKKVKTWKELFIHLEPYIRDVFINYYSKIRNFIESYWDGGD